MAKKIKPVVAETKKVELVKTVLEVTHNGGTEKVSIGNDGSVTIAPTEAIVEIPKLEEVAKEVIPDPEKIKEPLVTEELSKEQRILNYIEDKSGEIRLNDFLKSLFPLPKGGEPAIWLQQGSSRTLRGILEGLVSNMQISIVDNRHRLLGQPYYPDASTGKQSHHNLNTVNVVAKK